MHCMGCMDSLNNLVPEAGSQECEDCTHPEAETLVTASGRFAHTDFETVQTVGTTPDVRVWHAVRIAETSVVVRAARSAALYAAVRLRAAWHDAAWLRAALHAVAMPLVEHACIVAMLLAGRRTSTVEGMQRHFLGTCMQTGLLLRVSSLVLPVSTEFRYRDDLQERFEKEGGDARMDEGELGSFQAVVDVLMLWCLYILTMLLECSPLVSPLPP